MKNTIIEKLKEENKGLTLIEINDLLGLNTVEEYKELQKEITTLVSDGLIHKSKKDKFSRSIIKNRLCARSICDYQLNNTL